MQNILNRSRFAIFGAGVAACAFILSVFWDAAPSFAQNADRRDIFTLRSVPVDVTADTVTQAREQGLLEGRILAFRKLVERLVAPEDVELVPEPSASEIVSMVRDFSIFNERSSAVRYIANMTVRFQPGPIRNILRTSDVPFTETVSKPLIVVPLYREEAGSRFQLWDDPNPWRAAWDEPAQSNSLVPYVLPLGDLEDLSALSVEDAISGDAAALDALALRYQTGGSLVARAELARNAAVSEQDGTPIVDENGEPMDSINVLMTLSIRHQNLPQEQIVLNHVGEPGADLEDVMVAAADAAASAVQNSWKMLNQVSFDTLTSLTVLVPVTGIEEWVDLKGRLESVPLIERVDLQAMTRDRVQISVTYAGGESQFNLALSQNDLSMFNQNGVWVIEAINDDVGAMVPIAPQDVPTPSAPPSGVN